jgi:hypothetical protein
MTDYPIYKFGGRWICDGPNGRFAAKTKAEVQRLLRETSGQYDRDVHGNPWERP